MTTANDRQVGGRHYKQLDGGEEHWDRVHRLKLDYFQAQITKYVERWKLKGGVQDLRKAHHVLEKYIELNTEGEDDVKTVVSTDRGIAAYPNCTVGTTDDRNLFANRIVQDFGAHVAPTGWVGYTHEGADAKGFHFRCKACLVRFYATPHQNPGLFHICGVPSPNVSGVGMPDVEAIEPGRSYVNQDGPSPRYAPHG